jgi:hypothetical protein
MELTFAAGGAPVPARVKELRRENGALALVIETDTATVARDLFHDTPENRLETLEGGFNAELPVLVELELRPECRASLPSSGQDLEHWLAASDLLREDAWNAREVWQEHPVPEALGGGAIRVGYRTVFSAPRNEIDSLKRRGPVTRTVVEAFIENGLPVRFEEARDAFEVMLGVGEREYTCWIRPDEANTGLVLTVLAPWADAGADELERANRELPAGQIEAGDEGLRYVHEIRVDPALVSQSWVIQTLRAGVSVLHHFA